MSEERREPEEAKRPVVHVPAAKAGRVNEREWRGAAAAGFVNCARVEYIIRRQRESAASTGEWIRMKRFEELFANENAQV